MRNWCLRSAGLFVLMLSTVAADEPRVHSVDVDRQTHLAAATVVNDVALAHTSQILPLNASGEIIGADDVAAQTRALLKKLNAVLKLANAEQGRIVKLNLYLADDDLFGEVQQTLSEHFSQDDAPAVSYVSGQLAKPGVLVALDAVAAVPGQGPKKVEHAAITGEPRESPVQVSVLPRGGVVYISGQAEKGETLAECTRNTLAGLQRTLEFLKLDRRHVVQLKSFLNPMSKLAAVEGEIAAHFKGGPVPAHIPVEWTSAGRIEIELIAFVPSAEEPGTEGVLNFQTPPWMKSSPVFSRLAVVRGGKRLYVSGLYGRNSTDEIPSIFEQLRMLLRKTRSDFDHLAKATYYVATDSVSRELNEYRPGVYNPQRPPAASKAAVRGVGRSSRSITMDMIAVISK